MRRNVFNWRFYYVENYDPSLKMFDEFVHDNSINETVERHTCLYCMVSFESRNMLFKHLNFMNIDTRCTHTERKRKRKGPVKDRKKNPKRVCIDHIIQQFSKTMIA